MDELNTNEGTNHMTPAQKRDSEDRAQWEAIREAAETLAARIKKAKERGLYVDISASGFFSSVLLVRAARRMERGPLRMDESASFSIMALERKK